MTDLRNKFFERLNNLGTGGRATLRKEAGKPLRQADGKALVVFYQCLPSGVEAWQEDRWFAVACLRCMWNEDIGEGKAFETVIASLLKSDDLSDSTKHRVELLLDTRWESDGYLLTKLVRLAKLVRQKSDRSEINFDLLLDDLLGWNNSAQYVQRKWAKTIFSNNESEEKE